MTDEFHWLARAVYLLPAGSWEGAWGNAKPTVTAPKVSFDRTHALRGEYVDGVRARDSDLLELYTSCHVGKGGKVARALGEDSSGGEGGQGGKGGDSVHICC